MCAWVHSALARSSLSLSLSFLLSHTLYSSTCFSPSPVKAREYLRSKGVTPRMERRVLGWLDFDTAVKVPPCLCLCLCLCLSQFLLKLKPQSSNRKCSTGRGGRGVFLPQSSSSTTPSRGVCCILCVHMFVYAVSCMRVSVFACAYVCV